MTNRQALNHPLRGAVLLAALAGALAYGGAARAAGSYAYDAAKGKQLFTSTCAACHQVSGEGIPSAFPPLKGNAVVNSADPTAHLHTILFGAHGLVVGGVKYASTMPPFGTLLSDDDVAKVANYERTSWGNKAKQVTAAEVTAVRAKGPGAGK